MVIALFIYEQILIERSAMGISMDKSISKRSEQGDMLWYICKDTNRKVCNEYEHR